jgi:tetratricopeptide (TPR) repeat protein
VTHWLARALFASGCAFFAACSGSAVRPDVPADAPRPLDAQTLFARALAAQEAGEHDQAEALWKQVIAAVPDYAAPQTNLGIVYRTSGRLEDAIHAYEAAIRLDPADAVTYHNLGLAQRARGAWADAERAYLRALELRPDQVETHYNLAILYDLFLDRPEDALTQYRAVLSLGGPDADAVAQWIRTLERRLAQSEPAAPGPP